MDRILENLKVSGLLSERERLQVELHYSLLSGFVHATGYGYGTVQGRTMAAPVPPSYDHYLSELVLLYIIRLAVEEYRNIKRAFEKPPEVGLRGWATIAHDLDLADKASEHFWFLGASGPQLYDRVMSVDDEMFEQSEGNSARLMAMTTLDPMLLTLNQIRYDPNPLDRLIKMHADHHELTTGTVYQSPFPRADALYR